MQAAHAALEHAYIFGRPKDVHPSYVHLSVPDKEHLIKLETKLQNLGIECSEFHEPYKDWGLTAIAVLLTESERHLLSNLPLWRIS